MARVRSRGLREDLLSSSRLTGATESRPGQGVEQGSMVRSARILRVTRVAARLDCLQRLSNVAARVYTVQEKQTRTTNWCKISRFALCRSASRVRNRADSLDTFLPTLNSTDAFPFLFCNYWAWINTNKYQAGINTDQRYKFKETILDYFSFCNFPFAYICIWLNLMWN